MATGGALSQGIDSPILLALSSCARQFLSQTLSCDVQHWAGVEALCFGSTPGTLFTGSRDCSVKAWRQQERDGRWAFAADFEAHTGWVTALVAFPDLLASASYDTTIRLWRPSASVRFPLVLGRACVPVLGALARCVASSYPCACGMHALA